MLGRRPRLDTDDQAGVLRLAAGRHQLVVSRGGLWVRAGLRATLLGWADVDQVQLTPTRGGRARIEVFRRDGACHSAGPFPRALAQRWIEGCAAAAATDGHQLRPLDGAPGFGLPPPD